MWYNTYIIEWTSHSSKLNKEDLIITLDNIAPGQTVKNYKTLCSLLEEPYLGGNAKLAQLKKWQAYFSYTRQGNKFIINSINQSSLTPYFKGKYNSIICPIILSHLKNTTELCITYKQLLVSLGFFNHSYLTATDYRFKEWQQYTYTLPRQLLSQSLKLLQKQGYITYEEQICSNNMPLTQQELQTYNTILHEACTLYNYSPTTYTRSHISRMRVAAYLNKKFKPTYIQLKISKTNKPYEITQTQSLTNLFYTYCTNYYSNIFNSVIQNDWPIILEPEEFNDYCKKYILD